MKPFTKRESILLALLFSLIGFCLGRSGFLLKLLPYEYAKIKIEDSVHWMRSDQIPVYCTETGECYHIKGCSYLTDCIHLTLKEAKKRKLKPCSKCHPPETLVDSFLNQTPEK